jgi:CRP/FNR family transcriptional regulator, cyclic AMP receptor protein
LHEQDHGTSEEEPGPAHAASLPPPLRRLATLGVERRYRRGTLVIHEGDPGGSLMFIVSGQLRVFTARADGQEFTFGFCGPGDYLGELSLDGGPRTASAIVERETVLSIVTREQVHASIDSDPQLAWVLLEEVIRRARALSTRARDLALDDVYGRLTKLLQGSAQPESDGTQRTVSPLTQAQIAQQIGCSRTMVTKLIGDLTRGGYLVAEGGHWRLLKALPPKW